MNVPDAQTTPYEPNEDPPRWWRDAIDGVAWQQTELDGTVLWYRKSAPCPRCRHDHGIDKSLEAEGWLALGPEDDTDVFVECQCNRDHAHRPASVPQGCGWGGYVAGPVTRGSK